MKQNHLGIYFFFCFLSACSVEEEFYSPKSYKELSTDIVSDYPVAKSHSQYFLGNQLNNPYSTDIMQLACDSLCLIYNLPPRTIVSNHLYVRFLPQDSTDYQAIKALGIDIFDYPLDYEILGGEGNYHDPSLADDQMTWQYCSIPINTTFPNVYFEVIDSCYVPQPADGLEPESLNNPLFTKSGSNAPFDLEKELERLACQIANPSLANNGGVNGEQINSNTPSYPSGYIKVINDQGNYIPVKKIKVTARYFIKSSTVYTDENGYFLMDKQFSQNPTYSFQMINERGFEIYNSFIALTPYNYVMGQYSNSGHTELISKTHDAWSKACINNCTYDFYTQCINEGRVAPHNDLRINAGTSLELEGSGAPMLKHLGYPCVNDYSVTDIMLSLLHERTPIPVSLFFQLLRYLWLPDIVILNNSSYLQMAETVYHELTHAAHYRTAGTSIWLALIYDTIRNINNGYGNGTLNDNAQNVAELAESWAFANERLFQSSNGLSLNAGRSLWFNETIGAFYELINSGVLSTAQVSSCLLPTVNYVEGLYTQLCLMYPSKKEEITTVFAKHHALATQTVWKIRNSTSSNVYIYNMTYSQNTNFGNDSTIVVAATPYLVNDYPALRAENSTYYPYLVVLTNYSGLFYRRQGNEITTPLIGKDPFNASDWIAIPDTSNIAGNWTLREFVFNLVPSDYQ